MGVAGQATAADLLAAGIVDDVVPATDEARAEVLRRFLKDGKKVRVAKRSGEVING